MAKTATASWGATRALRQKLRNIAETEIDISVYGDCTPLQKKVMMKKYLRVATADADAASLVEDAKGTDQVSVPDPMLGPLQNNGGPTMTHALLPGSVAIDRIPEAACIDADGAPLTTDQRGQSRPAGAESMCDVGSVEV